MVGFGAFARGRFGSAMVGCMHGFYGQAFGYSLHHNAQYHVCDWDVRCGAYPHSLLGGATKRKCKMVCA